MKTRHFKNSLLTVLFVSFALGSGACSSSKSQPEGESESLETLESSEGDAVAETDSVPSEETPAAEGDTATEQTSETATAPEGATGADSATSEASSGTETVAAATTEQAPPKKKIQRKAKKPAVAKAEAAPETAVVANAMTPGEPPVGLNVQDANQQPAQPEGAAGAELNGAAMANNQAAPAQPEQYTPPPAPPANEAPVESEPAREQASVDETEAGSMMDMLTANWIRIGGAALILVGLLVIALPRLRKKSV